MTRGLICILKETIRWLKTQKSVQEAAKAFHMQLIELCMSMTFLPRTARPQGNIIMIIIIIIIISAAALGCSL